jgi:hypothetical protein
MHNLHNNRTESMVITILNALLAVALVGVVVVLLTGVASLAIGGEFNRKYANKLMQLRVATQALAVLLLILRVLAQKWVDGAP